MMEFLKTYDLVAEAGLLSAEEKTNYQGGDSSSGPFFFEAWTLDNDLSATQRGGNILSEHQPLSRFGPGAIAMYYPDLPESKQWLKLAPGTNR